MVFSASKEINCQTSGFKFLKAVVQAMPGVEAGLALAEELVAFCGQHLARQKVPPRSFDFADELPRPPTGKLYKRLLRDCYWGDKKSRVV